MAMPPIFRFRAVDLGERIARAKAALDATPTVGRCGFEIVLLRDHDPDVSLRCTKAKHGLDEHHAVTDENGEAIIWWPHPSGGFLLRGVVE